MWVVEWWRDRLKNKTSDATGERFSYGRARHLENCMSLPIESSVSERQKVIMFMDKPIRSTTICLELYTVRTLPTTWTKLPILATGFNTGGGSGFVNNFDEVRFASAFGCMGCGCGWLQSITAVPSSTWEEKQKWSTFQELCTDSETALTRVYDPLLVYYDTYNQTNQLNTATGNPPQPEEIVILTILSLNIEYTLET